MTWQEAVMGASGMAFVLVITVVLIMQGAATWRARMVLAHDVTDMRIAQEAMHQLNETLERRVSERTRELAAANHETNRRSLRFVQPID